MTCPRAPLSGHMESWWRSNPPSQSSSLPHLCLVADRLVVLYSSAKVSPPPGRLPDATLTSGSCALKVPTVTCESTYCPKLGDRMTSCI